MRNRPTEPAKGDVVFSYISNAMLRHCRENPAASRSIAPVALHPNYALASATAVETTPVAPPILIAMQKGGAEGAALNCMNTRNGALQDHSIRQRAGLAHAAFRPEQPGPPLS